MFFLVGLLLPGCHCLKFREAVKNPLELVLRCLIGLNRLKDLRTLLL